MKERESYKKEEIEGEGEKREREKMKGPITFSYLNQLPFPPFSVRSS